MLQLAIFERNGANVTVRRYFELQAFHARGKFFQI